MLCTTVEQLKGAMVFAWHRVDDPAGGPFEGHGCIRP